MLAVHWANNDSDERHNNGWMKQFWLFSKLRTLKFIQHYPHTSKA